MKCKASRCTGQRIQTASVPDTMLTTGITALFSLTCALAVANVYSAQPLLDSMAVSLKVSPGMIGSVITATQAGYAIGLLFLVPLGDWLNRKYVVMSQLLLSVAALVAAGLSPNIATLLGAMLIVGLMAVVVQVLVAWVAILATPQKRGQAVGTLTSGIVSGILLSRFISGAIADIAGWRAVYLTAACLMLVIAGVVWKIMPSPPQQPQPAKADLPFLIEVRVSAVPHRAATEKARDPGAIYLRRFQHAMDDHGHAAHRPFPLAHPDGDVWLSRLRWHAGRRQSGQVG